MNFYDYIASLFYDWGAPLLWVRPLTAVALCLLALILTSLIYGIGQRKITPMLVRWAEKTEAQWDDVLFDVRVLRMGWLFVCAIILSWLVPQALHTYPKISAGAETVCSLLLVIASAGLLTQIVRTVFTLAAQHADAVRRSDDEDEATDYDPALLAKQSTEAHSLDGVVQMLQLVIILGALVVIVSLLTGKNIVIILSGLGASAAVLMLVFKDSILGMVAGVQLTANDMLRPGDWITMSKRDVNGRVRKINLTTVKVQNYDNTIVTIPPYQLVSESFQNWRGMERSGGRRVMRSINIDMTTVRMLTPEEIASMEVEKWFADSLKGSEAVVNLTAFRAFMLHAIRNQATLVPGMLFMVRELESEAHGLPVQFYFFTSETDWSAYEMVQANFTDTILAAMPRFGLKPYQVIQSN